MPLIDGRPCSSGGRHPSRITRSELHRLAAQRGISALSTYGRPKTMDELCHELAGGHHGAGHVPAHQPVTAPSADTTILNKLRQVQENLDSLKRAGAAPAVQAPVRDDRDEILRQLRQLQNRVSAPVAQAIVHAPSHDNRNEILYRLRQLQNGPRPAPDAAVLNRLKQVQENLDALKRAGAAPAVQAPVRNDRDEILRQVQDIGRRLNARDGRPQDVAGSSHPNAGREGPEVHRLRDELAELRAQAAHPANIQALGARIDRVVKKIKRVDKDLGARGGHAAGQIQALTSRLERLEEAGRALPAGQGPDPRQVGDIGRNLRQLGHNVRGGQLGFQTQGLIMQQHAKILGLEAQVARMAPRLDRDPAANRRVRNLEAQVTTAERARNSAIREREHWQQAFGPDVVKKAADLEGRFELAQTQLAMAIADRARLEAKLEAERVRVEIMLQARQDRISELETTLVNLRRRTERLADVERQLAQAHNNRNAAPQGRAINLAELTRARAQLAEVQQAREANEVALRGASAEITAAKQQAEATQAELDRRTAEWDQQKNIRDQVKAERDGLAQALVNRNRVHLPDSDLARNVRDLFPLARNNQSIIGEVRGVLARRRDTAQRQQEQQNQGMLGGLGRLLRRGGTTDPAASSSTPVVYPEPVQADVERSNSTSNDENVNEGAAGPSNTRKKYANFAVYKNREGIPHIAPIPVQRTVDGRPKGGMRIDMFRRKHSRGLYGNTNRQDIQLNRFAPLNGID